MPSCVKLFRGFIFVIFFRSLREVVQLEADPLGGGSPYPDVISHEEIYQIVLVGGQRISDKLSSGI